MNITPGFSLLLRWGIWLHVLSSLDSAFITFIFSFLFCLLQVGIAMYSYRGLPLLLLNRSNDLATVLQHLRSLRYEEPSGNAIGKGSPVPLIQGTGRELQVPCSKNSAGRERSNPVSFEILPVIMMSIFTGIASGNLK